MVADEDIISHVPLSRSGLHPGGSVLVHPLEKYVCDGEFMCGTLLLRRRPYLFSSLSYWV